MPLTIQTDDGKVYRISHRMNQFNEEGSFWYMLAESVAEVRDAVGMEAFEAVVDYAHENLHLESY